MGAFFAARPTGRAIAGHAWKSLFQALGAMMPLFLSAMVLAILFSVGTFGFPAFTKLVLARQQAGLPLENVALRVGFQILETLVWAVLAAPVAVAMHRFILMDEISHGVISFSPRHTRLFLCWLVAIRLAFVLVDSLPIVSPSHGMMLLLTAVISIGTVVLSAYLAMLFPAVATEVPSESISARIQTSMAQIDGNFWLFVRAAIIAFLPVILLFVAGEALFFRHLMAGIAAGVAGKVTAAALFASPGLTVMAALFGIYAIVGVALAAALASWLYVWVRQRPAH